MKKTTIAILLLSTLLLASCNSDADTASYNLSRSAEQFEIDRRVVFYNWITWGYLLTIEWRCSILDSNRQLEVTCKVAEWQFKKHFLWLSDNVTYFAEQVKSKWVSVYHNRIIFKPQSIIPDIDFVWDAWELLKNRN